MYQANNVTKFGGLNSSTDPRLIEDGQSRDILNFRMEKVGKLVSRNGQNIGLYWLPKSTISYYEDNGYLHNVGIIGMGELVLESKWEAIDSDRLMVYVIRGGEVTENFSGVSYDPNYRNNECYLLAPLTGQYTDRLISLNTPDLTNPTEEIHLFGDSMETSWTVRDNQPQGSNEATTRLFAPNKAIPDIIYQYGSNLLKSDCPWIKQYVDLNQYRNRMVISDRVNGDMVIEDEANRRDTKTCVKEDHQLHLRPNALQEFDIDTIKLDLRLQDNQENDIEAGVETGMGLYNYVLPKEVTKPTVDASDYFISNPDTWRLGEDAAYNPITNYIEGAPETMLAGVTSYEGWPAQRTLNGKAQDLEITAKMTYDNTPYRRFTNTLDAVEFDDVLGKVELKKEEYIDYTKQELDKRRPDGTLVEERAADVYIWEDYRIKYYPSAGKIRETTDWNAWPYLMRDIDRDFQKTIPGTPRITKLYPKKGAARYAPLGVWKYKFVYDFGDGTYSAPSTDIVCPDVMWSATTDDEVSDQATAEYTRPRKYHGVPANSLSLGLPDSESLNQNALTTQSIGPYTPYKQLSRMLLYNANGTAMTQYGESLFGLKYKLYKKASNRYGIGPTIGDKNAIRTDILADEMRMGDLACSATAFFSETDVETKGIAWEYAKLRKGGASWSNTVARADGLQNIAAMGWVVYTEDWYHNGPIKIPIFARDTNPRSWNSVFDDEGRYRWTWLNEETATEGRFGFFLPWQFMGTDVDSNGWHAFLLVNKDRHYGDLYLAGLNPQLDYHNAPIAIDTEYKSRPHTMFRGIKTKNSADDLYRITPDIPNEVVERLLKVGTVELNLVKHNENIYWMDKYKITSRNAPVREYRRKRDPSGNVFWQKLTNAMTIDAADFKDGYQDLDNVDGPGVIREMSGKPADFDMFQPPAPSAPHPQEAYFSNYNGGYLNVVAFPQENNTFVGNTNLDIYIYGSGTRFLGPEQLSSYFPSSLLYQAPRVGIKIDNKDIPKKAKRILIFRTRSTHSNEYVPTDYGIVDTIDLDRDANDKVISKINDEFGQPYEGFYYFDVIKDLQLDFGDRPDNYEGLRRAIKSRFNLPLNERVYYFNFEEGYRPEAPRKWGEPWYPWLGNPPVDKDRSPIGYQPTVTGLSINATLYNENVGYAPTGVDAFILRYRWAFVDADGKLSEAGESSSYTVPYDPTGGRKTAVALIFLPDAYDASVKELRVYRCTNPVNYDPATAEYFYIGKVRPGDEGIFIDDGLPDKEEMPCTDIEWETYESGLRWSEPYHPDWIKPDSFTEVRSGDGKQGTGLEAQYGNIVAFKETSIHRLAVQAQDPPLSRIDEVTSEYGCIAPNALLNINNMLYFLSFKGWRMYNNNEFKAVDQNFGEELRHVIQEAGLEKLRDSSCGYNPAFDELYLNIPKFATNQRDGRELNYGTVDMYGYDRTLMGNVYVVNMGIGYSTKFAYPGTILNLRDVDTEGYSSQYLKESISPLQHLRMYYTNSLGQMRSADMFPSWYGSATNGSKAVGRLWAGVYTESPYTTDVLNVVQYPELVIDHTTLAITEALLTKRLTDEDAILDFAGILSSSPWGVLPTSGGLYDVFPETGYVPIEAVNKSKFFSGDDETIIKRIRKVFVNMFSKGPIEITVIVIPHDTADDNIENIWLDVPIADQNRFNFDPAADYIDRQTVIATLGTNRSILSIIPKMREEDLGNTHFTKNDFLGKPIRFSIEIKATKRTQVNEFTYHWRPIHGYLS